MTEHIDQNKGGLFNRQTCRLFLCPFSLHDTEEYLDSKAFNWSRYDIAQCYMIMGGIPFYLSLLKKSQSLDQNIDRLFFANHGELWDEFDHLYATLGISGVLSEETIWYSRPFEDEDGSYYNGAQIDLLIERRDRVINICEMKFCIDEFTIDKDYDRKLRNKISSFTQNTKCRNTIQLTLVTTYGIKKNKYSNMVSNEVVLDDLF